MGWVKASLRTAFLSCIRSELHRFQGFERNCSAVLCVLSKSCLSSGILALNVASFSSLSAFALSRSARAGVVGALGGGALSGSFKLLRFAKQGREIKFSKDFRIAPFGNGTNNPLGQRPHYHRRGPIDPKPETQFQGKASADIVPGKRKVRTNHSLTGFNGSMIIVNVIMSAVHTYMQCNGNFGHNISTQYYQSE